MFKKIVLWILKKRLVNKESVRIREYLIKKTIPDLKEMAKKTKNPYDDELINFFEKIFVGK